MADTKYSIWYEADYEIPLYVTEYKKLEMWGRGTNTLGDNPIFIEPVYRYIKKNKKINPVFLEDRYRGNR